MDRPREIDRGTIPHDPDRASTPVKKCLGERTIIRKTPITSIVLEETWDTVVRSRLEIPRIRESQ
jgi:hypothetical protein